MARPSATKSCYLPVVRQRHTPSRLIERALRSQVFRRHSATAAIMLALSLTAGCPYREFLEHHGHHHGGGGAGSGNAGSGNAGSGEAGSGDAGSGTAGSSEAGSGEAGSGTAGSSEAGS